MAEYLNEFVYINLKMEATMEVIKNFTKIILAVCVLFVLSDCKTAAKTVVIYTSVDQVYSEKIFKQFENKTGIKVKAVYDIEASKSVGLANRLIAEKNMPKADVFWNGEILQTLDLKEKGVLDRADISAAKTLPAAFVDSDGYWYGFGGRARVLLVNKSLISLDKCPHTLEELAESPYLKKAGIAYPVFGTTATQAAALYAYWGDVKAKAFYTSLYKGGISVLEGNSVVKDFVSQKKLFFGLTDSDDALSEMEKNKDLAVILLDQGENGMGTLVTPNTVAFIKGAPHPSEADAFMEFLLSSETEQTLVNDGWIHIPAHADVTPAIALNAAKIKPMAVDFNEMYKKLESSKNDMIKIFIK